MKRCSNCDDFALYDDEIVFCPICNSRLVEYTGGGSQTDDTVICPQSDRNETFSEINPPVFETVNGNTYVFRGTVTEISPQSRWNNRHKKIFNSLFTGEPYQFGNTSQSCVIRIEEFHTGRMASQMRNVVFYGEIEGRIVYGDDVIIVAKRKRGRFIATSIQVNDTEETIKPQVQIPAGVIRFFAIFLAILALYLIIGFIGFVATGSFVNFLNGVLGGIFDILFKIFGTFAPFIIIYFVVRTMFKR